MGLWKEFEKAMRIVNGVIKDTKDLSFESYLTIISMCLEERCKQDGRDMVETCECLLASAKQVSEVMGRY